MALITAASLTARPKKSWISAAVRCTDTAELEAFRYPTLVEALRDVPQAELWLSRQVATRRLARAWKALGADAAPPAG